MFSDDLSGMAAISDRFGVSEAVLRTLQAGADIALWVTTKEVPAVLDRLEQALRAGELPMSAVDRSVVRVATMKGPKGGTKRLPRAVREQQMLDAAVQMFSVNG
ncbi:lipoprotein LpqI [Mycobacterium tuberculosis]|uniref:beta-N-acetylhexosaminidase n=1 Tax=Mycobacterium tuberculosis TaxID=1773 RepID=A0A916P9W4_MYCTX|nr:lipoprotein LpqI [Mycobacterium tuberculosis]